MFGSKVALITNASSESGKAITKSLLEKFRGFIYVVDQNKERALELVEYFEIRGYYVKYVQLDLTNDTSVASFRNYFTEICHGIDVFIHNDQSDEQFLRWNNDRAYVEKNFLNNVKLFEIIMQLMNLKSRIVYVSNAAGNLELVIDKKLYQMLSSPTLTIEMLGAIVKKYLQDKYDHFDGEFIEIWSQSPEVVFRTAMTALIKVLQNNTTKNVYINAIHAGIKKNLIPHERDRSLISSDEFVKPIIRLVLQRSNDFAQRGNFIWLNGHSINYN